MALLIPCTVCQRHVRRQEAQCPFCGAARTASTGPFREIVMPRDATRATILALGLSLASQACGGKTDGDNDPAAPGSGASVGIGAGGSGNATGGTGGTGGQGGSSNSGVCDENPLLSICNPAPPYGLSPFYPPEVPDDAGSADLPDAAAPPDAGAEQGDAGPEDAGG
ncbi:MAG TPA: hypothetical protein VJU61_04130 [Polyangiaceae bacterium]|nr:hypothetical protein [Polyangiaceae bacterium]